MRKLAILILTFMFTALLSVNVSAQNNNTLFPQEIQNIFDLFGPSGSGVVSFVVSRIQLALFIAIGFLVLVAVVYALIAAFKYIRSQGDPGEIEEAQKAIKAIFFGIAAMLIAIIGIVLVFVFFGVGVPEPELFQTCVSAPNSVGCQSCRQDGNLNVCQFCEEIYQEQASRRLTDINDDGVLDTTDIKAVAEISGLTGDGKNCVEPLQGGNQP